MGLFTFIKSLFSSKDYVKEGAQVYEAPVTKEIELFTKAVEEAVAETPKVEKPKRAAKKTSAKPKKQKTARKKSDS